MPRGGVVIIHPMALVSGVAVLLAILGSVASPRDGLGRPILLLPDVRAARIYQGAARGFVEELRTLDADLTALLAAPTEDIYERARQTERVLARVVELNQSVDKSSPPAAMGGLKDSLVETSLLYLEAGRKTVAAVSQPTDDNLLEARDTLLEARTSLEGLEGSPWLTLPA